MFRGGACVCGSSSFWWAMGRIWQGTGTDRRLGPFAWRAYLGTKCSLPCEPSPWQAVPRVLSLQLLDIESIDLPRLRLLPRWRGRLRL